MSSDQQSPTGDELLATGGGNATAAGVSFQAAVGAAFASRLLADRNLDERLRLGNAALRSIRFETEAPLDDVLVETSAGGWVFIQAKTSLSLSTKLDSELGKTAEQIVRQFQASASGTGARGWDRPFDPERDRMLIAVGSDAPGTIKRDLAAALTSSQAPATAPLPQAQQQALDKMRALLASAWQQINGVAPGSDDLDSILRFLSIIDFNLDGPDRTAAVETLAHVTENAADASAAFSTVERLCERLMATRRGTDAAELRQALVGRGVRLRAAPTYRLDVERLRTYSARVQAHLTQYEETRVGDVEIKIERDCTAATVEAARDGSLVLVGEPGAGKSAVVSAAAERLRAAGNEVIELAVDRLLVESLDGLRIALELDNGVRQVLENWPGAGPAFLFIDALDATRGGKSEAVFRSLISEVLELPGNRWRVIASIRTFDLKLGEQFKNLFEGEPPSDRYVDSAFRNVRHLHIPRWSDDELGQLRQRAPLIAAALDRAGDRLRDLARVPFNTRLLADLIGDGVSPDVFGGVSLQVELLALYWQHRITPLGSGADLCLRTAVGQMITNRGLQANRLTVAQSDTAAFDHLLRNSVLIGVSGNRNVAFRHHILFDYAASRVFIDPADVEGTGDLLRRDRGLGLMLAPALSYALQDLWVTVSTGHQQFWQAVAHFAGDHTSDPVARSVAARAACELPAIADDMHGFTALLSGTSATQRLAFQAFSHIVGALSVRIEDGQALQLGPWCSLASAASNHIADIAWPLRTLLFLLSERTLTPQQRAELGLASRRLLDYAIRQTGQWSQIASAAVGFVADTFESDIVASRRCLEQLLAPDRLREHAHEEMPWLARKVLKIGDGDPSFVPDIYRGVFSHAVTEDETTYIGDSQILPLSSNRRQDYEMARWTLKEAFPRFLQAHAIEGVHALVAALDAYVENTHPLDESAEEIAVRAGASTGRLIDDRSHIWAWNPNDRHSDNAVSLVQTFSARLREATEDEALQLAREVIAHNRLAVLWSRLFQAASTRGGLLANLLWPFAAQRPFLVSQDTTKDAIDLIASGYARQTVGVRESFERDVLAIDFPLSRAPERARQHFQQRVFRTIGIDHLVTAEAQQIVRDAPANADQPNRRPFEISSWSGNGGDRYWWLREDNVDVTASPNAELLAQLEDVNSQFGLDPQGPLTADPLEGVALLSALWRSAEEATGAEGAKVVSYAKDIVGRGCTKLSENTDTLRARPDAIAALCDLLNTLLADTTPNITEEDESKDETALASVRGGRVDGAESVMNLCRVDAETAARFPDDLRRLVRDAHPAVRFAVAWRLVMLWDTARDLMWELADIFAEHETNPRVLRFFADFLTRVLHADPARVEQFVFTVLPKAEQFQAEDKNDVMEALGSITAILWVTHTRSAARARLDLCLSDLPAHEPEISHAIHSIRGGLVVGYGTNDANDAAIRARCQQFAAELVGACATGLQRYFDLPREDQTPAANATATKFAKLLDNMCDQFYFASGAFRDNANEEEPLADDAAKTTFLNDNYATFHRIGDVGTPHTIFHLIEMLGYLIPADAPRVFDLAAHALLTAGRQQRFQFESLGADRFVQVIGVFLADHREVFDDLERRDQLVACLEAFVDAGWPSARRLLYRLPELL
ncbi:ATP-binding protein [Bradyrhizobium rifense]|uniref:ATP-binding protein n=1 Tax=Bradyrhizobium rifense TaxID=515499 RepID=A0A5D3K6X5_9BRAD|nr:ATP-binding protein [Bradyrhizobium rifense]TYL89975.1 ATP-binding protein [Bradyrhizobium rifense]